MNQLDTQRLRQFIGDTVMSQAVYDHLLSSFMKKRQGGTDIKAAQMIAIEILQEAWAEMERYKFNNYTPKNVEQSAL